MSLSPLAQQVIVKNAEKAELESENNQFEKMMAAIEKRRIATLGNNESLKSSFSMYYNPESIAQK